MVIYDGAVNVCMSSKGRCAKRVESMGTQKIRIYCYLLVSFVRIDKETLGTGTAGLGVTTLCRRATFKKWRAWCGSALPMPKTTVLVCGGRKNQVVIAGGEWSA